MQRAAPAKKRRLSTMAGTSSPLKASIGLPALADSSSAISSARSSRASASLRIASERSIGVLVPQPLSKAVRAAFTARSTSSWVELAACAISSPVAGFRTASVRPSAASTDSPSMKFLKVCVAVAIAAFSLVGRPDADRDLTARGRMPRGGAFLSGT
jgi:hypothetical protein